MCGTLDLAETERLVDQRARRVVEREVRIVALRVVERGVGRRQHEFDQLAGGELDLEHVVDVAGSERATGRPAPRLVDIAPERDRGGDRLGFRAGVVGAKWRGRVVDVGIRLRD